MKILKINLISICYILISTNISSAMSNQPTLEQKKAINLMHEREKLLKNPVCNDPVIISIADARFSLPRTGLEVTTENGELLEYLDHRCEIKKLDHIRNFRWPFFGITDSNYAPDFKTMYQHFRTKIDEESTTDKKIILSNGLTRVQNGYQALYITSLIKTANNEPVVFNCPLADKNSSKFGLTDNCTTGYFYKKNLLIGYTFFRKEYPDENYLRADEDKRQFIDKLSFQGDSK